MKIIFKWKSLFSVEKSYFQVKKSFFSWKINNFQVKKSFFSWKEHFQVKRKLFSSEKSFFQLKRTFSAELTWIRAEQATFLATELKFLRDKTGARPHLVSQLDLYLDKDAIIRCNGRLRFSHLNEETKHPIFIPKQPHLASLIIQCYHERRFHTGPGNTVNSLRQRFWSGFKGATRSFLRCWDETFWACWGIF